MSEADIRLLIAEDEEHLGAILEHFLASRGYAVTMCRDGRSALAALRTGRYDVALLDIVMPELDGLEVLRQLQGQADPPEVITITGNGTIDTAITAIKLGAYDYISKPYRMAEIDVMVRRAWEKRELLRANDFLRARVMAESSVALATESARMRELAQRAATVAPSREPIVIRGEAGVGKTHLARYIHARSSRRADVYVEITDREGVSDMTTYLFGEEPHTPAGTTAGGTVAAHPGLLQRAARGTVVIDAEVLTEAERAAVSAALTDGEFSKVGGQDRVPLAARIIICERHAESAWPIGMVLEIPPLRSRPEDYGILALQLVRNIGDGRARTIGSEVATILSSYTWPANVRELRAVLMRAALLASSTQVSAEDVRRVLGAGSVVGNGASEHAALGTGPLADSPAVNSAAGLTSGAGHALMPALMPASMPGAMQASMRGAALADLERAHIETMLIQSNWHQGRAAQALGISTKTLYRKMREYGFIRPRKRKFTRTTAEESTLEPGRVFSSPLASGPAGVASGASALASSGVGDRHSE